MLPNQSFVWTGATPGVRYRFAILADAGNFLPDQCSTRWGSTDFGSRGLPGSPGFSGVPTRNNANGINVSWNDYNASYGVQHWRLYRSASAANRCSDTHIATLPRSTRSFLDSSAAFNTDYYYTFIASDLNGVNGPCSSNSAAGFRPGQAPTVSAISVSPATVVAAGTTVNLGVSATGAIPSNTVAYQWRAAGQVVGGSSPSYSFVGQGNHGTKQYDVLVSHPESAFSVTRSQNITVCRADQIVSNNACVCPGTLQEIGGQCACPPPLVRVDNQCLAPTPTPTATPLPNSFPQIINQPQSQSVQEGQSVTFGVVAAGNPVPNYQWFRDNLNPVGGNDPQYSFVAALSDNGARFKVRVSNSVGSVDSNEVILTVQSAPRPLRPVLECVMANNDGTLTAFFGYENQNIAAVTIPAGTNSGGDANLVNGGSILPGTQQPIDFSPGRVRGAFGVVFSAQGSAAYTLGYRGTGIVTETANSQSTPCAPIEPRLACVNPEGAGFRARFTYSNQNAFNVIIPSGPNNRFSPAPEYRDQPINFLAALGQSDHFEVVSSSGGDLTWILANLSATASGNSTPCSLPPVCNAGGPYRVQQGQNQVTLNASGSFDPEGLPLIYAWSTTCPGASIAGTLSPLATLNLVGNRQTCAVNLA
ncbi:MAG: hypothetical protein DCC75_00705, partial [Proteobacteria bacterium]